MTIEIFDQDDSGILLPTLKDILLLLPEGSRKFFWSILEAEVIRKDEGTINVSEIEGKVYSWADLVDIASEFFQEINIVVVACKDEQLIPRAGVDLDYHSPCEIVIEGIDTTLWQVYARNAEDLELMRRTYKDIEVVEE